MTSKLGLLVMHNPTLWITMTSLYVYYRVQASQREAWLAHARQLQMALNQYCESTQLSCRQEDPLTIMETYHHLHDIPAFKIRLEVALADIQPERFLVTNEKNPHGRHEEWFVDC